MKKITLTLKSGKVLSYKAIGSYADVAAEFRQVTECLPGSAADIEPCTEKYAKMREDCKKRWSNGVLITDAF